jgi:amino acid adenylation domain-containing protein
VNAHLDPGLQAKPETLSDDRRQLLEEFLEGRAARPDKVRPRRVGERAPISAEQRHVWLHAAMAPNLPLYNEAITVHRRGDFRLETLQRAFNAFLRRHELWRSSIEAEDGELWLTPHDLEIELPLVDLTSLPETEREAVAKAIAEVDARTPFDLASAPLLRAKVVRLAPDYHRLYLTLHHIIFDGVTIYRVLMPEFAALYAAFDEGRPSPLPEPRVQYADYALWRARRLTDQPMERELDYWRGVLAGELPDLTLPADRKAPSTPSHAGSMETFELTPTLSSAVKAFAAREGITQYVVLLAAFKALLARYSSQDDIVIGGVTDMRRRPELEGVVGYFLNSVPLRTRPALDKAFRSYLAEVQDCVVAALDASEAPFDLIVQAVSPRRDGARHPLFQVLFSIEPPAPPFADGWDLTQMDVTISTAKFDLYLELDERDDHFIGRFLYSAEKFSPAAIRRMIDHWRTLLASAIAEPQSSLGRLELLTQAERSELLERRNSTAAKAPNACLHALFERQARRTPRAIAVEDGTERWTYAKLDRRADEIASRLRAAGVAAGDLVGVSIGRSATAVAGLLAVLKCGAAYLPLDPALPAARLRLLLEDARPAVTLADHATARRLPIPSKDLVLTSGRTPPTGLVAASREPGSSDLAYVIYTSGSTGRPKGVEVPHSAVVNLLSAIGREIGFSAKDALLAVTTFSFDIAALEIFLPLVSGARLVLAASADVADSLRLAHQLERVRPSIMQATPSLWRALINAGWTGERSLKILCGGEALAPDLAAALAARGAALWNLYGPTETTIWSAACRLTGDEVPAPIGRPLANTRVYVVDALGGLAADGVVGELAIAGAGLARGYRGDPGLTAAKFVTLPAPIGERVYLTGDRARWRPDGALEFLGRADNQVKVRGHRLGLEEIESALASHPRVEVALVAAEPDASGETVLVAYLTGARLSEADIGPLRAFLRERLPAYMVPGRFAVLSSLPLTPNGKADRKRLPKLAELERPAAASRVAPRDDVEQALAEIWRDVLGIEELGVDDDFFDLGGHSLLASFMMTRIKARFGRALPLSLLFQAPTIAGLGQALRASRAPAFSHLVRLKADGVGPPLFIVHGIYGSVMQFKDLAGRLRTHRPIFALQAADLSARTPTIDEMAIAYLAAIREAQPAGPYALAGYSFGGVVAYAMACRLRGAGEVVDVLAMLETDLCERFLPWPERLVFALSLPVRAFGKISTVPLADLPGYLSWRTRTRADARGNTAYRTNMEEWRRFRPPSFDGALSVFRVRGPRFRVCDPTPIWKRAAAEVRVFDLEGEHATIMEPPFVDGLARQLEQCLTD